MTKFKHKISQQMNTYKSGKGVRYIFSPTSLTEVTDPEDVEYFKNHSDFEAVGLISELKEKISKKSNLKKDKEELSKYLDSLKLAPEQKKTLLHKYASLEELNETELSTIIQLTGLKEEEAKELFKKTLQENPV